MKFTVRFDSLKFSKIIVIFLLIFFCSSCFMHPLWKPYFFPEKDDTLQPYLFGLIPGNGSGNEARITSLSKSSGVEGETITIEGANFSSNSQENKVRFSGSVEAEIVSGNDSSLTVQIPPGAKSGIISVETPLGSTQSEGAFTVYRYFISFSTNSNSEVYALNLLNGEITSIPGSPFSLVIEQGPKFTLNGKFAFSGGFGGLTQLTSYSVNPENGKLTVLNANAGSTTQNPVFFAFHPSGKFLYVSSNATGAAVAAFGLDQETGSLAKIADYTGCGGCNLNHIATTPNGKFLYVNANSGGEPIIGFSIDQTNGALTRLADTTGEPNMDALMIDSTSKYLYSVAAANIIIGKNIDQTTGALANILGNPFAGTANNFRAAIHPSGKYLYTVNIGNRQLAKHDISSADGSLSAANSILQFGAPGSSLQFVRLDPTGSYGFVSNHDGAQGYFFQFRVDPDSGVPSLMNSGNGISTPGGVPTVPEPFRVAQ
ncbi:beta-propeller fold lactonase family protein [Leptospira sp. GIMC2001]|uniref:beta-propeller fold lactonase family protein n=1 Tax=Leptospira sp. GIMC2001 TaxID=1513297 RepID=UPI00234B426B|nr:beta-propeller fold lactonase family protein [Leptospira sp. GIMC2001]WCL48411.1 beta-propeller fold lactonase family protein [Leptospira sp. GIMC2001]